MSVERLKQGIATLARLVLGDYAVWFIYASPADLDHPAAVALQPSPEVAAIAAEAILTSTDATLREQLPYLGDGAQAYGCFIGGKLAGVCIYWFGERYRTRQFWPLRDGEAKLVQLVTAPGMRGRGVASALIAKSGPDMAARGFCQLYARVWHSNVPSWRAFARCGWIRIALVFEVNPLRRHRPWRFQINLRPSAKTVAPR